MALTKTNLANIVEGILPVANGGTGSSTGPAAGGSNTQIQYNNAGALGGSSSFVFDGTNVGIGTSSPSDKLQVTGGYARIDNSGASALRLYNSTTQVAGIGLQGWSGLGSANDLSVGTVSSNNTIFMTALTERMRITSAGVTLLGTTNTDVGGSVAGIRLSQTGDIISCIDGSSLLHYQSPIAADRRNTAGDGVMYGMWRAGIYQCGIGATNGSTMTFFTGNNASQTERMRIDSSGNLLVGTTSTLLASGSCFVNNTTAGDSPQLIVRNAQNTAGRYWKIGAVGGAGGANPYMIVYNASNAGVYMGYGDTNWSSTSDESKKENLVPITDAVTKISSLRTVIGNFIDDEEKTKHPFLIAQDVQKVLPEAVNEKDGVLGLKYSDIIPLLVASIKELNAKVTALETQLASKS